MFHPPFAIQFLQQQVAQPRWQTIAFAQSRCQAQHLAQAVAVKLQQPMRVCEVDHPEQVVAHYR